MAEYITVWENHEPTKLRWGVPVVRCRDCKWCMAYAFATYCDRFHSALPEVWLDGFCAWGEKEEGK